MLRAFDKHTLAYTDGGEVYRGENSLVALLDAFPGKWIRVHRSMAVRPSAIVKVKRRMVYLDNGESHQISRRQYQHLYERSVPLTAGEKVSWCASWWDRS